LKHQIKILFYLVEQKLKSKGLKSSVQNVF